MTSELSKLFLLFLRYYGWLAIYFPLFFAVSFPAAYFLDLYFPEVHGLLGKPGSIFRFISLFLWIVAVTILIWPVWHRLGDLFLPDRERLGRFKIASTASKNLRLFLTNEFKKNRTGQSS